MNIFLLVLAFYMLFLGAVLKPSNLPSALLINLPILLSACALCALGLKGLGMLVF